MLFSKPSSLVLAAVALVVTVAVVLPAFSGPGVLASSNGDTFNEKGLTVNRFRRGSTLDKPTSKTSNEDVKKDDDKKVKVKVNKIKHTTSTPPTPTWTDMYKNKANLNPDRPKKSRKRSDSKSKKDEDADADKDKDEDNEKKLKKKRAKSIRIINRNDLDKGNNNDLGVNESNTNASKTKPINIILENNNNDPDADGPNANAPETGPIVIKKGQLETKAPPEMRVWIRDFFRRYIGSGQKLNNDDSGKCGIKVPGDKFVTCPLPRQWRSIEFALGAADDVFNYVSFNVVLPDPKNPEKPWVIKTGTMVEETDVPVKGLVQKGANGEKVLAWVIIAKKPPPFSREIQLLLAPKGYRKAD